MRHEQVFRATTRFALSAIICSLLIGNLSAAAATTHKKKKKRAHNAASAAVAVTPVSAVRGVKHRRARYSPWTEPTYSDSTAGDLVDGEDPVVRRAAVEALGQYNGSVVVVNPQTGRILTMVNQKLALGSGFQPCSTIKVAVALAALQEKLVERATKIRLYGRTSMAMTDALAHSNNYYFANLGIKLGYERVNYYARLFGYGETAGLDIPGEKPGFFPSAPPKNGGVGMLTSFGEEISQTPLQLAALMSALSNGGTLYYLQYPRTQQEIDGFVPRVKRQLEIQELIREVKHGQDRHLQRGPHTPGVVWILQRRRAEQARGRGPAYRRPPVNRPHGRGSCGRCLPSPRRAEFLRRQSPRHDARRPGVDANLLLALNTTESSF
jgi:hypothetical protein